MPTCLPVVGRAERVAAVLDEPQVVLARRSARDRVEVERVAERVGDHDRPRPRRRRAASSCVDVDVVGRRASTSTNTGTRPFWTIGLTVVGKPAATVITSSPGCSRRSPSFGEVSAETASRFADEPGVDEQRVPDADACGELALELARRSGRSVSQKSSDASTSVRELVGVEDAAGDGHRRLAGHERRGGERGVVVLARPGRGSARAARRRLPGIARRSARGSSAVPGDRLGRARRRGRQRAPAEHRRAPSPRVEVLVADLADGLVADVGLERRCPSPRRIAATSSSTVTRRLVAEVERLAGAARAGRAALGQAGRRRRRRST